MNNFIELLSNKLFGGGGLGASDFKLTPGTDRDVTPEQAAAEVLRVLDEMEKESRKKLKKIENKS